MPDLALPLAGTRVLDLSTRLAGAYATKLLADAGADVVSVEDESGHELRGWSASGGAIPPGEGGPLFRWLHGGRRSVAAKQVDLLALREAAEIVVVDDAVDDGPGAVVVAISDFGGNGPWAGRPASDLTLQAESGSIASRGVPELPPVAVGGRLGEWTAGVYAAAAAVAALRNYRRAAVTERIDVSVFECMLVTQNMHEPLHAALAGSDSYTRWVQVPSVERTADGWVCFSLVTGQQWLDFTAMIGRPDLGEDAGLSNMLGRWPRRQEVYDAVEPWLRARTVDEVVETAAGFRLPVAHVSDGATVADMAHFTARGVFAPSPHGGYPQPTPPFHSTAVGFRTPSRAPRVGEHTAAVDADWVSAPEPPTAGPSERPLHGVRIVDLTAFWAGPSSSAYLAALGADVVKVEAVQRPDGIRFAGGQITQTDGWWDWSWVFQGANAGKRGITLDLTSDEGRSVLHRLLADADVLMENYSPRVMEQFGLGYEALSARHASLVVMRMPAYGLDGPWSDRVGFALTMEALAGMAITTGHPDGRPTCPGGALDPIAGMHAAFATLLALEHRTRTGDGLLVEVPMIECALNVAAEPLLEHGAYGAVLGRTGNRGIGPVLQDVYTCAGEEAWLAVALTEPAHAKALAGVIRDRGGAVPAALTDPARWSEQRERLATDLQAFFAELKGDEIVEQLIGVGVPAAVVRLPTQADRNPHLEAGGFYEAHDHPALRSVRYPVLPTRFASWTGPVHARPAPMLGQHNDEVLGELGVSASELAGLRERGVIGERPAGL
jgi:crotonobetainyl-CoA:carnitine CoA-transferase CaiB-like acyl-CoA transferase